MSAAPCRKWSVPLYALDVVVSLLREKERAVMRSLSRAMLAACQSRQVEELLKCTVCQLADQSIFMRTGYFPNSFVSVARLVMLSGGDDAVTDELIIRFPEAPLFLLPANLAENMQRRAKGHSVGMLQDALVVLVRGCDGIFVNAARVVVSQARSGDDSPASFFHANAVLTQGGSIPIRLPGEVNEACFACPGVTARLRSLSLVEIEDGYLRSFQSIRDLGFHKCPLQTVDLVRCSGLQRIGRAAFSRCFVLTRVKLSCLKLLQAIPEDCFILCRSMQSIEISDCPALTTIEKDAFNGCEALSCVRISMVPLLGVLGCMSFDGCRLLPRFDFGALSSLRMLDNFAFANCSSLTCIDCSFHERLEAVGDNCFSGCKQLRTAKFSGCSKLMRIGRSAFSSCRSLEAVMFSNLPSLETIGGECFANCPLLTRVDLSGCTRLKKVGLTLFADCGELTSLKFSPAVHLEELSSECFDIVRRLASKSARK